VPQDIDEKLQNFEERSQALPGAASSLHLNKLGGGSKLCLGKFNKNTKKSDLATTLLYVQTIFMIIHFHSINFSIDDLPFSMHIFHIYFPCVFHAFWDDLPGYSKGNSDGSHGSPGTIGLVELHRLLIREAGAHC